jgi:rhamnogalacturonyl hydrolase YesR
MIKSCPRTTRALSRLAPFAIAAAFHAIPAAASHSATILPAPGSTARVLPIFDQAFAGSSVNMLADQHNTLFTHNRIQYAAFYAADGALMLAKRELGSDQWTTAKTRYWGKVKDAHNAVSLIVDGDGYLHVAWNHHATALSYCRSLAPGSLELGRRQRMTGRHEDRVTYPSFYRLADGDLLFLYRAGRSGQGNIVLNRYATRTRSWQQVHASLVDGEGARSAYWSAALDARGVLHLVWNWRESPDVASNHDLCYARSADGGKTWTKSDGVALIVPIVAATAEYAARIPERSSLMNPPSITADSDGAPYITSYWAAEGSQIPQFHLVRLESGAWRVSQITNRTSSFTLQGAATKRPPISRSVFFTHQPWRKPQPAFLVYRDDDRGGKATLVSCADLARPEWRTRDLTAESLGAWEPSLDPEQWQRMRQLHLLVQPVDQRDGDDSRPSDTPPTQIASLVWSPYFADLADLKAAPDPAPDPQLLAGTIVPRDVLALMRRAADWQWARPPSYDPRGWEVAPFYIGTLALAELTTDPKYEAALVARAEENGWEPARRVYHADDHCVMQAYLRLYEKRRDTRMLAPSRARLDAILAKPADATLDWGTPRCLDRWSWCDALFMGPMSWLMMGRITGEQRYVDFMHREWKETTARMYHETDHFYARDESYLDLREPNGRHIYWARGNGWVVAGLSRALATLPQQDPLYPRYRAQYLEMMESALAAQQPDGLWRPGLLDPVAHQARETSGSSFMTFALAWGARTGLLDRARVEPAVRRAWNALATCVSSEGRLEHVQPIGAAPEGFEPEHTEPFGIGAFLLAGSEVYRLFGGVPESDVSATH